MGIYGTSSLEGLGHLLTVLSIPFKLFTLICAIFFFPGANTGIGKETALDLAKRGARLILLCRNVDKAKKAAEHIKKTHNGAQIAVHQLDLASLKSVRNCAQTLIDTEDKIDILVNNAGEILLKKGQVLFELHQKWCLFL